MEGMTEGSAFEEAPDVQFGIGLVVCGPARLQRIRWVEWSDRDIGNKSGIRRNTGMWRRALSYLYNGFSIRGM
jgi:hypothetical protein